MAATAARLSAEPGGDGAVIFVTVGTTMPFDELFVEVDRLAGAGLLGEPVICQTGQSAYRMQHAEQFAGRPSIDDLIAEASLVVSHGGATVLQLLRAEKPFVAFPNPRGAGDHQTSFLRQAQSIADVSWSSDVTDLERLLAERRAKGAARVDSSIPRAGPQILAALGRGRGYMS